MPLCFLVDSKISFLCLGVVGEMFMVLDLLLGVVAQDAIEIMGEVITVALPWFIYLPKQINLVLHQDILKYEMRHYICDGLYYG